MQKRTSLANGMFVLGYGLYKAAGGSGYLSAMGMAGDNTGFVSTNGFMLANTASSVLACLLIAFVAAKAPTRFLGRAFSLLAYGLLVLDFLIVPQWGSAVAVGVVYGVSTMVLSVSWFVACVEQVENPAVAITCGLLLSTTLQAAINAFGVSEASVLVALLVLSAAMRFGIFGFGARDASAHAGRPFRLGTKASGMFLPALLCLMVCVFVVGASNVAALGSSLEPLFGGVDMQTTYLLAAIGAATVVFCGEAAPDPTKAYTRLLPVLFALFSLIPLLGEGMGPVAGSIMVGCYQAIAILFAAFSVKFAADERLDPRALAPLCFGASSLALLLGLAAGTLLGLLGSRGLPLPVLVMLVSVYPLGLVLFFVTRRRKVGQADGEDGGRSAALSVGPAGEGDIGEEMESAFKRRATEMAARYGLTKREEEILVYVARGRSARVISDELFISENTTWSHIKRIYAKTGKHSKQELLDLFEER